jgi:hypothetical protein
MQCHTVSAVSERWQSNVLCMSAVVSVSDTQQVTVQDTRTATAAANATDSVDSNEHRM